MTYEGIKREIEYLQDDNLVCRGILNSPEADYATKNEARMRIQANNEEIRKLKKRIS